jgi:LysM repeat protein
LLGACTSVDGDSSLTSLPPIVTTTDVAVLPPIPSTTLTPTTTAPTTTTTQPAPTTSTYASWVDVIAAESSGVFRIHGKSCVNGTASATGFLVAPGVIATAAHVVDGYYDFSLDQFDGDPQMAATPIAVNVAEDVALLSAPAAIGFIFSLADHEPPSGTTVGLIGFSDGRAPARPIRGDVGQINVGDLVNPDRAFQHNLQTNSGDSGSPILDTETGEVLGVHVAGYTTIQGFKYAVYLDALRILIAEPPAGGPLDGCNLGAVPSSTIPATTSLPSTTVATTPPTTVVAGPLTYRVHLGDTVFGIARAFNTTVDAIVAVNGPAILDVIHDSDIILLPSGARPLSTSDVATTTYTVKSGDTIIGIAKATGTTPAPLLAINGKLSTPDVLAVGQVLLIPRF